MNFAVMLDQWISFSKKILGSDPRRSKVIKKTGVYMGQTGEPHLSAALITGRNRQRSFQLFEL